MTKATHEPKRFAARALGTSLALTSLIGGTLQVLTWLGRGRADQALARSGIFVIAMAAIHWAGYQLYTRQPIAWSPLYGTQARAALAQQILMLLVASTILDGGAVLQLSALGFVGFWAGVGIIICRRPESPTRGDLDFIHDASMPLALVSAGLALGIWRIAA